MSAEGYSMLLSFDSEEPEFARGFEAGRLWQALLAHAHCAAPKISATMHHANAEMVLRMADALGFTARAEELDDTFAIVRLTKAAGQ